MIWTDVSEPDNIELLLNQSLAGQVDKEPLNAKDLSDYYMVSYDAESLQFSRKQAGELLGDIDEAERQIRDYYNNADHNFQICEGLITPMPLYLPRRSKKGFTPPPITSDASIRHLSAGGLYSYSVSATGWIGDEMAHKISGKMFYAWIYQLEQCGVPTFFTINYIETAKLLVAIHDNIQKDEHTTLQRYIKPKLAIKKKPKLLLEPYDLQVMTLMGVQGARIGEKTAKALIARFEDTFGVANASVEELAKVEGIGKKFGQTIFDAFRVYSGLDT